MSALIFYEQLNWDLKLISLDISFSNLHKTNMILVNKLISNLLITNTDLYTE